MENSITGIQKSRRGCLYEKCSFAWVSNDKALIGKIFFILDKWSLMRGGSLGEVVAHEGSTAFSSQRIKWSLTS